MSAKGFCDSSRGCGRRHPGGRRRGGPLTAEPTRSFPCPCSSKASAHSRRARRCAAPSTPFAAPPAESRVTIDNFTFKPDVITVPVGTRIVWENDDDIPHSIVETQGKFHSPALDTEDKYGFTFATAGSFEYFCGLHPHMKGKVVVTP